MNVTACSEAGRKCVKSCLFLLQVGAIWELKREEGGRTGEGGGVFALHGNSRSEMMLSSEAVVYV